MHMHLVAAHVCVHEGVVHTAASLKCKVSGLFLSLACEILIRAAALELREMENLCFNNKQAEIHTAE